MAVLADLPGFEKALGNELLVGGALVTTLLLLVGLFVVLGGI